MLKTDKKKKIEKHLWKILAPPLPLLAIINIIKIAAHVRINQYKRLASI